jgi:major outer membrane protein
MESGCIRQGLDIAVTGAVTKKILVGVIAIGCAFSGSVAFAGQTDDLVTRLDALERENAAIRTENAALIENKRLREHNAKLKSADRELQSAPPTPVPVAAAAARPESASGKAVDVFGAYAADLPVAYKAAVPEAPGQFRIWAEGGAIWSGGDPISQNFNLVDFTTLFSGFLAGGGGGIAGGRIPGSFDLTPKVGWEAATGFDYRFPGSPWHVSGQFRYGEGGKTNGTARSAGTVDPVLLGLIAGGIGGITSAGGSEVFSADYKERHWLADLAIGRDVFGSGANAMQLKGGIRISEFVSKMNTTDATNQFFNFAPAPFGGAGGPVLSSIGINTTNVTNQRNAFLGAGPRIGLEGSVPFAGNWAFDYLGDVALLFGTQKSLNTQTSNTTTTPAFLAALLGGGGSVTTTLTERFGTVLNGDIQLGISYWVSEHFKVSASYRLDAFINVQNQGSAAVTNLTPDRYTHGPRLAVTGQF